VGRQLPDLVTGWNNLDVHGRPGPENTKGNEAGFGMARAA
jgi:hypothetical protein